MHAMALRLIAGDEPHQFRQAPVAGVMGAALPEGINGRVGVIPGGIEIRLAHAQGDDPLHFADDIEKFPDAGRGHLGHPAAENLIVIHGLTCSRSSSAVSSMMTPSVLYFFRTKWVAVDITPSMVESFSATNSASCLRVRAFSITIRS